MTAGGAGHAHRCFPHFCSRPGNRLALCQYERTLFQRKWREATGQGGRYYNPNLTLDREDCSLRF